MADGSKYFSVLSLIIMFRETIEASIIVAILLSITTRIDRGLNKQVWIGALGGVVLSIALGIAFIVAYITVQNAVFKGNSKLIFEGVLSWFAAVLVCGLSFAMLRLVNVEEKLKRKLEQSAEEIATGAQKYGIMILAFAAVIREGIESVVFLAGIGTNTPVRAIPIPAIVGVILGVGVGVLVYYTGIKIKQLKVFFVASSVFLWFIAGGLVSYGYMEFQGAGVFGEMYYWWENRVWYLQPVWDGRDCCSVDPTADNKLFLFLKAVFGFSDLPTPLQLIIYFCYWTAVIMVICYKISRGNLYGVPLPPLESKDLESDLPMKVVDTDDLHVGGRDVVKSVQLADGKAVAESSEQAGYRASAI